MTSSDEHLLRQTIALARQAREQGEDPFAALLVQDGIVVHQAVEGTVATGDPTAHAELRLISEYCRGQQVFSLEGHALYASAEPCPMCAGAIHWARIARVVFSVSQEMLQRLSGGRPKPSCASVLSSYGQAEIVGPLLAEEGLAAFEGYTFRPRAQRHRQRLERTLAESGEARFCSRCGAALEVRAVEGRPRGCCSRCGRIHYEQLKVGAGAMVEREGRLLLLQRAHEPFRGCWNLPAGYVEVDEDPARAVVREVYEEAGLAVVVDGLAGVYFFGDDPRGNGLLIVYRCGVVGGKMAASAEGVAPTFFARQEIPGELAGGGHDQAVRAWLGCG
jgi:tRNA(Arg) A34 adenosine deaminase TadA/ADP-ribose pyrophosphatase YjhB (NUDIX family)